MKEPEEESDMEIKLFAVLSWILVIGAGVPIGLGLIALAWKLFFYAVFQL